MKIASSEKVGKYLVFTLTDGSKVKFDFSTGEFIGKSGKVVSDLKDQLSNNSISHLINTFPDENYRRFLDWVDRYAHHKDRYFSNIGTFLLNVRRNAKMEQIFSAGIKAIDSRFTYTIGDLPKGLIKILRDSGFKATNRSVELYNANPGLFQLMYDTRFTSITHESLGSCLLGFGTQYYSYGDSRRIFDVMVNQHLYHPMRLLEYVDYLMTYEALATDFQQALREVSDYATMAARLTNKFDKYPENFLTIHRIVSRNYERLRTTFVEQDFAKQIKPELEFYDKDYVVLYPKTTQDIKNEAIAQSHCVASYIKRVIDGETDIVFMRHIRTPEESLVTLQVTDKNVVQARGRLNRAPTAEENVFIRKYKEYLVKGK